MSDLSLMEIAYYETNMVYIKDILNLAINEWKRQEIDWPTDRSEDIQYVQKMLQLVEERKWKEAKDMAFSMDSEPREMLPGHFWEYD